jgi:CubicO group peptidase (beta-lactamase class C family)
MYKRSLSFGCVVVLCVVAHPARAQGTRRPVGQVKAEIESYMKTAVAFEKFSGAILVAYDGKPLLSRGYGLANVELDAPNTPDTVFRLASLTKQFTAASVMMLQERGKLKVDDAICRHLPDCPAAWQPITVGQLMNMTSGIPGPTAADIGAVRGLPVPLDQWMEATRKKPLEFSPGTEFRYANSGYVLLGLIIERLSGKSYGEFLQENIFGPLGMNQSGYENPLRIIKNRATGYRQLPGEEIANVPYAELLALYAAGGVYSTTKDLLLWDQALYGEKLLSRRSIQAMATAGKEMLPGKGYGFGWWMREQHGRLEIAHGGNLAGFITYLARYPSDGVTVIVLSNNGRGSSGKISGVLGAIVFGAPYELAYERKAVPIGSPVLDRYVGEYRFQHPPTTIVVTNENGRLFSQRNREAKVEMFAESESRFFLKSEDIQFRFQSGPNGGVTGVTVDQGDGTLYEVMKGQKVN